MNEQRLGVQTGFWQNALRNETASVAASASITGVWDAAFPRWPSASARNWSGLKMMMLGFFMVFYFP
jgi:hypothetical protein